MTKLYCVISPFPGYCEFETDNNQMVTLFGTGLAPMSTQEFIDLRGDYYRFVNSETLNMLFEEYYKKEITSATETSLERFDDMLNILPPCRWQIYGEFEMFYVSERICGNLVCWYAKHFNGKKFFTFIDNANLSYAQLINKMKNV